MNKVTQMRSGATSEVTDLNEVREYKRIPWSGNLDDAELARPGGLLLAALIRCANERRQQLNDMARELGVTYGYINQLRNGVRQISQISDDFALACARYLGVPRLSVLMLSGRISPEDAFESKEVVVEEIPRAMKYLVDDPEWGPLVPPELREPVDEASRERQYRTQFLIVRLYEEATGKKLLPERVTAASLGEQIQKLQALQAQRQEAVDEYRNKKSRELAEE